MKKVNSMLQRVAGAGLGLLPGFCFASNTVTNAWEGALESIVKSLTGPVIYFISIMAIFICGLVMAFADLQGGARRFVQVACGISIAMFSASILTNFLGFQGALI